MNKQWYYSVLMHLIGVLSPIASLYSVEQTRGPILLVVGTRPEAIKMASVYHALKKINIPTFLCSTGQHADLLPGIFNLFEMQPDIDLKIMKPGQDLFDITTTVLERLKDVCKQVKPALVLVQGDTTTAMAAALAAFYLHIPVGHVEAGLRTYNMLAPFPEELNRRIITHIAELHFAPTDLAVAYLVSEGIACDTIFMTGNAVVDAARLIQNKIDKRVLEPSAALRAAVQDARQKNSKLMVVTAHRRESIPEGLRSIFTAIKKALVLYPELYVIFPVHPNPVIRELIEEVGLSCMNNILLTRPLSYTDMQFLLGKADVVATDSGGLQEEALSLNKPVLVLRKETERSEGVTAGLAVLVGDDEAIIVKQIGSMLACPLKKTDQSSLYGDGHAGLRIASIIQDYMFKSR